MSIFEEIRDSADGKELSNRWYRFKVRQMLGTRGSFRGVMADADTERRKSIPEWGNLNLFWYRPRQRKSYLTMMSFLLFYHLRNIGMDLQA